jgi:O-antigen ligase
VALTLRDGLLLGLFCLLPLFGLINGPAYAPAVFGVAVLRLAWPGTRRREALLADPSLAAPMLGFLVLSWVGLAWSAFPARTLSSALQASLVLPGAFIFVAGSRAFGAPDRLARVILCASLAGAALLVADRLDGYVVLRLVDGAKVWPTKYNRGIDYFTLLALPTLAFSLARQRFVSAGALGLAVALAVAGGLNTTAQVALPCAVLVAALATAAPRLVGATLAGGTALLALSLPFILRLITNERPLIAPHIKSSGLDRLEIWDYLSAHVMQRPLLGWGLGTARDLPATAQEMAHYLHATGHGIYPHNQWLELWVETGLPGVLLGLCFSGLILWRIWRLAPALRPAGYAAYVVAMAVAFSGFEVITDSWWAALASSAALFAMFGRALAMSPTRILPVATPEAPAPPPRTIH